MKEYFPTKILVSGGWGYGNLGDDAILISTIKLARAKFPEARIVVMSYDCRETKMNLNRNDVTFIPSIHLELVGNLSKKSYWVVNETFTICDDSSFLVEFAKKLSRKGQMLTGSIKKKQAHFLYKYYLNNLQTLKAYQEFQTADLFIQAGGGYFNDGWVDSIYAHVLELHLAHHCGVKSMILGQSIGPFGQKKINIIAKSGLALANFICIRDLATFNELHKNGIKSTIIPDTALSELKNHYHQEQVIIVVISAGIKKDKIKALAIALINAAKTVNAEIKITISRRWQYDIEMANKLYLAIKKFNINRVSLMIPKNYTELQDALGVSKVVVSQNLHGLILGWRAGVPGICLTNGRKFVAFMEQSNQEHLLFPLTHLISKDLEQAIIKTFHEANNLSQAKHLRHRISKEIIHKFNKYLTNLLEAESLHY